MEAQAPAGQAEALGEQLGELAFAAHAAAEAAVVGLAAARLAHQAHDVLGALREMFAEPLLEQRRHLVWQAQQHVASRARPGVACRLEQALELHVVDHRDHRRAHHADRHAGLVQGAQGPQACGGRCGARLHDALEFVVQRGEADRYAHQALLGQRYQQIEVAQHQRAIGDDVHRVAEAQQHLQRLARQPLLAFQRLVGVGIDAQGDRLGYIARLAQFGLQAFGKVGLGDQPRFEIDPRREVPVGVAGSRKAVNADVLG